MGDRFYMQQKEGKRKIIGTDGKPKRILKADILKNIEKRLGVDLPNLIKTDKITLETLLKVLELEC